MWLVMGMELVVLEVNVQVLPGTLVLVKSKTCVPSAETVKVTLPPPECEPAYVAPVMWLARAPNALSSSAAPISTSGAVGLRKSHRDRFL